MSDELNALLRPHDHWYWPETGDNLPVVLFFHGSSGRTVSHEEDWGAWFNSQGYALLAVDSFAGRGVDSDKVSTGEALWGNERSADVAATLAYVRTVDRVDASRCIAMGFSHGGWTAMDALALHPEAASLAGIIALYPYSGPPAAHRDGWSADVPVLVIYAGADTVVSTPHGIEVMEKLRDNGCAIEMHNLPGTTHTFDHAKPNAANIAAGSLYDADATKESQRLIAAFLDRHL